MAPPTPPKCRTASPSPAIFGNEPPTETAQPEIFTTAEVATEAADPKPAAIQ